MNMMCSHMCDRIHLHPYRRINKAIDIIFVYIIDIISVYIIDIIFVYRY